MPNPDKPRDRPTVPEVLPLARVVYARHCGGCCAHVVIDDGNVEQVFANHALDRAREQMHQDCMNLCEALVRMTPTQRKKIYQSYEKRP